ncbi:hypothetical protein BO70DRAFT_363307 [Aspergillus heteromorphus CBS 117.55]|uniref:Uncharacterized protein n=1 Tax=Aspergillus heteromorphus CBS 117.55 TaxID=1448321 RepID=A0A317VSQ4_9EURO|nr:uncharacterized protein BO70DRAFT_363307 [Aspergillus heteromorphus CBS 117.55]PWY77366.1 hypothetical protein BO70DRAFT_363307 [Aspergillus heteromorphus CBS 117.55]
MSQTNIKCEKLQILPYPHTYTYTYTRKRSLTRPPAAVACPLRERLYSPGLGPGHGLSPTPRDDFLVPDSPADDHVIVLPSPRDLQKFRISVYR